MKATLLVACLFLAATVAADDAVAPAKNTRKPTVRQLDNGAELPVIAAPAFEGPLDASFSVAKGTWTPAGGILTAVEVAEEKHVAVLHHNAGLRSAVIECDFRLIGSPQFLVGCDGKGHHVGRVVVRGAGVVDIAEDSGKNSHVIASLKLPVTQEQWHHLRVEWMGDEMIATLDGQTVKGRHPYFATPKARSWLAVPKSKTEIRNLVIRGERTE